MYKLEENSTMYTGVTEQEIEMLVREYWTFLR